MQKFEALRLGDPASAETNLGPQADSTQADTVSRYLEVGSKEGTVLTGGSKGAAGQNYITPTIFEDVPAGGKVNVEEIFGPVLIVHSFQTADEAIRLANDTECKSLRLHVLTLSD